MPVHLTVQAYDYGEEGEEHWHHGEGEESEEGITTWSVQSVVPEGGRARTLVDRAVPACSALSTLILNKPGLAKT